MGGRVQRGTDAPPATTKVTPSPVRRALPRSSPTLRTGDRLPIRAMNLLDAQHTAGNRAVGHYLRGAAPARSTAITAQRNWSDAKSGGASTNGGVSPPASGNWNAQDIVIGAIRRKTIEGLDVGPDPVGNRKDDAREGGEWGGEGTVDSITKEKALGKAVVLVPEPLDKAVTAVDVMIYLHGYGIGYRQRVHTRAKTVVTKGKKKLVDEPGMEKGTVRDIEVDHMEEQLDAVNAAAAKGGGRPMIAVLPQGRYTAGLGPQFGAMFLSEPYLDKVFGKVGSLSGVTRGRAVLAGHSGAGGTLAPMLGKAVNKKGELKSATDQQAGGLPQNLAEVVLFDALNSEGQRLKVQAWLIANIRKDLRELAGMADPQRAEYLAKNMVRFRGYYSSGYAVAYTTLKKDVAVALKSELVKAAPHPATRRTAATTGITLTAAQLKVLEDNYVNSIEKVPTGHEKIMGTGKVKEALTALPVQPVPANHQPGVQQPGVGQTPGVQRSVVPLQRVDPPVDPDLAQWTADWNDPQFAGAKRYFNESSRPSGGPETRYKIMCPLYKAHGIARPLQYLKDSINPSTTFFGHSTPAHTGMQAMLTAAEKALRALQDDQGNPRFNSSPFKQRPWALNVRTTSKNTWSNHADGRAIDLDPNTNPHLDNSQHRAIITEMTGFDIEARNPGDAPGPAGFGFDIYDSVKMASDRFSGVYNEAGLSARSTQLTAEQAALVGLRDAITVSSTALKARRQKITKDRDAALKLTRAAPERAAIKQQAALELKDVDAAQADLKKQLAGKKSEVAAIKKRTDRIAAELKKFKKEQKAFDTTVASITTAEAGIATADADINAVTGLRDAAQQLLNQARKDKRPKVEITALQKDLTVKSTALGKAKAALSKNRESLKAGTKKRDDYTLRKHAREGFIDLPKEVVKALQAAGFKWGGDWAVHKDIMHFDMP